VTRRGPHAGRRSRRYDTTSILALIEHRWGLAPLSTRDDAADPLSGAFDFSQTSGQD